MKLNKGLLHQQRRDLDQELKQLTALRDVPRPRKGWIKAIREALGLSSQRYGELLGIDNAGVLRMEQREIEGALTLETLDRAARAMDCRLIYAIVPEHSLEEVLDQRAELLANEMMKSVSHSMHLENQQVEAKFEGPMQAALKKRLMTNFEKKMWSTKKKP